MYTEYKNLPETSRVWIYQSNRPFSAQEIEHITKKAITFIEQWTRHGEDLKASFTIKYDHFLVLAVDESFNNVSGCSIDSSVKFIKELEQELQVDLMDKLNVSFKDSSNINIVKLSDFQEYAKRQKITSDTIVFNNMVTTKYEFENQWEVPASKSWHNRFLV